MKHNVDFKRVFSKLKIVCLQMHVELFIYKVTTNARLQQNKYNKEFRVI